ncbi:MAG TPA: flagellar hook capping FlgD N-terminal domain-containing protein [Terracidiphilus sp.]|jgi:flagellar basal-body rod modification protein FlgD|nr:flagellar hook capping FlgD N-terminal domain-containing protein [Terracidiphilus sp.]HEX4285261.1 flagellar hook capping FlgD N-terminal domain-containing protein [Terracidiphilus sp.]
MAASALSIQGAETSTARASAADTSTTSSGSSATISANDFLTLLVTEMQNQDPTATTDPNEYINQLVNVNSLEQLVDINQTLTSDTGATNGSRLTGRSAAQTAIGPVSTHPAPSSGSSVSRSAAHGMTSIAAAQGIAATSVKGNLSIPKTSSAANSVAHALSRH